MTTRKKKKKKKTVLIISLLITASLLVGGGILIIKHNSKAENASNNRPTKEEKKPIPPQKDNPQPNKPHKPPSPPPQPIPKPNNPPQQNNNEYGAITASGQEPEYKTNPPLPISSVGTVNDLIIEGKLPAGSALLTDTLDGSGNGSSILNSKKITHIIHATPRSRDNFSNDQDFINGVVKSIQNSIILADRYQFEKLAIPFVGGGIYLGSCDPEKLAEGIIRGAVNQLEKCQNLEEIWLIDWTGNPQPYFLEKSRQLGEELLKHPLFFEKDKEFVGSLKSNGRKGISVKVGDIRDKNIHGASVIVNDANLQVKFGGGISGAIAEQVGDKTKIEQKAQELIGKFNRFPSQPPTNNQPKLEIKVWCNFHFIPNNYPDDFNDYYRFCSLDVLPDNDNTSKPVPQDVGDNKYWFFINKTHPNLAGKTIYLGGKYPYKLTILTKDKDKKVFEVDDFVELELKN